MLIPGKRLSVIVLFVMLLNLMFALNELGQGNNVDGHLVQQLELGWVWLPVINASQCDFPSCWIGSLQLADVNHGAVGTETQREGCAARSR